MSGIDQRLDDEAEDALKQTQQDYDQARKLMFNRITREPDANLRQLLIDELVRDGINARLAGVYGRFRKAVKKGTVSYASGPGKAPASTTNVSPTGKVTVSRKPSRRTPNVISNSTQTILDYLWFGKGKHRKPLSQGTKEDFEREAQNEKNRADGIMRNHDFYLGIADGLKPKQQLGNKPKAVKRVEALRDEIYADEEFDLDS